MRSVCIVLLWICFPCICEAEELFITIHKVVGDRIAFVKDSPNAMGGERNVGQRARGLRGFGQGVGGRRGGRGRSGGNVSSQYSVVTIPADVKITSAMRERRTFEFRVGIELVGGMRNPVFANLRNPIKARIVTNGERISQLNVITSSTDINQLNTDEGGRTVIAVRPKRPPSK
ncbi:MAG: hypothetical protein AAF802_17000 [Planctomycetota bacterium]